MAISGNEIYRCYDELGIIQVFENRDRRFLTFDGDAEQSCILLNEPWSPVYQYCQTMLMATTFCEQQPKRALMAGLGGGSMIHSLLKLFPELSLDVLELREQVIDIAQRYFFLYDAGKHSVINEDAGDFLLRSDTAYDLIFSDLFLGNHMNPLQLAAEYMESCQRNLNDQGILVVNLWLEEKQQYVEAYRTLNTMFSGQLLATEVPEGNLILFLFKGRVPEPSHRRLQRDARRLGKLLNAPLQRIAARMVKPYNTT